ncbi:ABC transporter permease [Paenibacillus sp. IITD108]|uniref:ABC transporter permease n=1 Tax=Paenibacillus sp. IITD108 TaxID=3116649 RepID=UPI002F42E750
MRIKALIIRIIRQFVRDKRTLALLIAAPLLVITLMYLVFNGDTYKPTLGVWQAPEHLVKQLEAADISIMQYDSEDAASKALGKQELDAIITLRGEELIVRLEGSDPAKSKAVMLLLQQTMQVAVQQNMQHLAPAGMPQSSQQAQQPDAQQPSSQTGETGGGTTANPAGPASGLQQLQPHFEYLHGSEKMTSFDNFGPVLIGVFSFFFVFLIAGISFLKERTSGTLERLLATPLRRWEIVVGYIAGFGIFTSIQAMLIAGFSIQVLGLMMVGSIFYVLLITLLLSITALSLGTFLSAFAKTELQMIQFIPIVIVPQVFFSGLFDLDTMLPGLRWLSYLMPLRYGADALRDVMIRGEGWQAIAVNVFVLAALSLIFIAANIAALRKHRKI